ncbi:MAG: flagellar biosynthesis protein [Rhodobacteraceae bacterium]|nr:flagellar biosynthesis protein [Paracoccaceae bacterium]
MARRIQLDVFELPDMTDTRIELGQSELEECRLTAYEQGYSAGWDDAVAAQDREVARLRSDLGASLQEMSFTYEEARGHVLRALEPLLSDMVAKVLPAIAHETLVPMILDELRPAAADLGQTPVTVIANGVNRALLEKLLVEPAKFPILLKDEPSLSDGQVFLKFGKIDKRIDLDSVIAAITKAVRGFFAFEEEAMAEKEQAVG